jgi:hypothetical protein
MKKKYFVIVILLFILVNILLRLPTTPHEIGWDSYFIHGLANTIIDAEYIKWTLSPLSLLGLYPNSYASSVPILLSELSLISGIKMEVTIFLISIIFGLLSMLTGYLLSEVIFKNKLYRLITAFLFSTSLYTLYFTTWTTSSRAIFFLILVPLFLYFLLKNINGLKFKYLFLCFIIFILMLLTHRLSFFIFIYIFAFVLSVWIYNKRSLFFVKKRYFFIIYFAVFLLLILLPFLPIFRNFISLLETNNFYSNLLDMSYFYIRFLGILLPLCIIGIVWLMIKRDKTFIDIFLLVALFLIAPLLSLKFYMLTFAMIILVLLSCIGLIRIISILQKPIFKLSFLIFVIVISLFTSGLFQVWNPNIKNVNIAHSEYIEDSTYSMANWIQNQTNNNFVSVDDVNTNRLNTLVPCKFVYGKVEALNCGFLTQDQIEVKLKNINDPTIFLTRAPFDSFMFNYYVGTLIRHDGINSPKISNFLRANNISYYLRNDNVDDSKEVFAKTLILEEDKVFDSKKNEIWYINN